MLKKRIIGCLVVKDDIVVQSIGFNRYLPVGKPKIAVEFLNDWGVDEIVLLDISASKSGREPNYSLIKELSNKCYVPLTVGGGIYSIEQVKNLMDCGADKICINQCAFRKPGLINDAAIVFGSQCIVVSVDVKKQGDDFWVYDYLSNNITSKKVLEWCREVENFGAGEIFLTSVDRDGAYNGYEIPLLKQVANSLKIPVIASGGAAKPSDFIDVFKNSAVSAASAANMLHFSEHSVTTIKSEVEKEINIRLDTQTEYRDVRINDRNRLEKRSDEYLEDLLYIKIDKEII